MNDICLSGAALAVVGGLLSSLTLAVVTLYRALLAAKDAEIERLLHQLGESTSMTERSQAGWRQAQDTR